MQVKLLSGELISLPAESEEECKKLYTEMYIPEHKRPWTRVETFSTDGMCCLVVNTYTLLPRIEEWLMQEEAWDGLSRNPAAVSWILQYPEKINWNLMSANPGAIEALKKNLDKISWPNLSCNQALEVEELFVMFPEKVIWRNVALYHPHARRLLDEFGQGYYDKMFLNPHIKPDWVEDLPIWDSGEWPLPDIVARRPSMISLITAYYPSIKRRPMGLFHLNTNPEAWELIKDDLGAIDPRTIVWNTCPEVSKNITRFRGIDMKCWHPASIDYLRENPEEIDPNGLVGNPRALDLIEEYADRITKWGYLVSNAMAGELIVKYIDRIPLSQELLELECIIGKNEG